MVDSKCCRCGTTHVRGRVARYNLCIFCWSPACCNNACHLNRCRGLVALAGVNMAAAQDAHRFAPSEFVVTGRPRMTEKEYKSAIQLATSALKVVSRMENTGAPGLSRPAPVPPKAKVPPLPLRDAMPPPKRAKSKVQPVHKAPAPRRDSEGVATSAISSAVTTPRSSSGEGDTSQLKAKARPRAHSDSSRHSSEADVSSMRSSDAREYNYEYDVLEPPVPPSRSQRVPAPAPPDRSRSGAGAREAAGGRAERPRFVVPRIVASSSASGSSSYQEGHYNRYDDSSRRERSRRGNQYYQEYYHNIQQRSWGRGKGDYRYDRTQGKGRYERSFEQQWAASFSASSTAPSRAPAQPESSRRAPVRRDMSPLARPSRAPRSNASSGSEQLYRDYRHICDTSDERAPLRRIWRRTSENDYEEP